LRRVKICEDMITRRSAIRDLTAGAALSAISSNAQPRSRRPNFIVIVMDDLGCTDLGCYGAGDLKTPNIDALAASGVRFTNWYSNAPVCAPARASLMTGRFPVRAGVPANGGTLPSSQITIAELLKRNGYTTGLCGKWHLGMPGDGTPNDRGFDEFYGFHSGCVDFFSHRYYWGEPKRVNYHDLWRNRTEIFDDGQYLTERLTDEALQFVDRHQRQPFFLYLAYNAPHYPMHAPAKYIERFASLPRERRTYAAMISAVDDGIGRLMTELRRTQLLEDTCIFLLGDNGATSEPRAGLDGKPATAGSNRPYRGNKFSLFDGGMHVPAMMSWPGRIKPRQVSPEVVMTMDIYPTVAALAGAKLPEGYTVDGSDMFPVAAANAKSPHDAIFWTQGGQLAIRKGKWKLVVNGFTAENWPQGSKPLEGEDAMFLSDLESDPGESHNLRRARPEVLDELATLAYKWKEQLMAAQPARE
jgi:arylsulfatase A-like enzyme